jgi:tRNA pseudouridine55 synthase
VRNLNGILNVNKPAGMTSHDVVAILRRLTRMKRIGHTGTLDPMATGVLPVCLGKATRIVEFLSEDDKSYQCEMRLGFTSDTQDVWGQLKETGAVIPEEEEIEKVLLGMIGDIDQIPPMFSALKVGGKKLYELAREGIEIERAPRRRHIRALKILEIDGDCVRFDVTCSKGTYIRTLCHDAGNQLGCGAIMTALVRTASGVFKLEQAMSLETLDKIGSEGIEQALLGLDTPFLQLPRVDVDFRTYKLLSNGVKVDLSGWLTSEIQKNCAKFRLYYDTVFIGLGTHQGAQGKPTLEKLLTSGDNHVDF